MTRTIVALAFTLLVAACGGGAKEMLETAQFEELQRNTTHARELYRRSCGSTPDSPEAVNAKERLAALDAAPRD